MSVSTTTDRVTYAGNGVTTAFSFPYILFATGDLKVYLKNNTTGAETLQTITTHYTLSGTLTDGVYEGGVTVTFLTAPTASQTVLIYRDRSVTQDLELDENGKIPSGNLEKQLDKLTTDVQRIKNKQARSVGLKEGFTATFTPDLPAVMVNDGYLKTNAAGDALEYVAQQDLINTISTGSQTFSANRVIVSDSNGLATSNPAITADRALVSDANGLPTASSITATVLGYLSGVTSSVQNQLNAKLNASFGIVSDVLSFTNQGSDPSAPSAGFINLYTKAAGLFYRISAGTIRQVANLDEAQSLTNKDLDNSNTITVRDDRFTIQDNGDTTKRVVFQVSGITTGTTRTNTWPNYDGVVSTSGLLHVVGLKNGGFTTTSTTSDVTAWTAEEDANSVLNTTTGVLTIPTGRGGLYQLQYNVTHASGASGDIQLFIQKNGTGSVRECLKPFNTAGSGQDDMVISWIGTLAAGDTLRLRASSSVNGTIVSTNNRTSFYLIQLKQS